MYDHRLKVYGVTLRVPVTNTRQNTQHGHQNKNAYRVYVYIYIYIYENTLFLPYLTRFEHIYSSFRVVANGGSNDIHGCVSI